jgi:hypothetical protein
MKTEPTTDELDARNDGTEADIERPFDLGDTLLPDRELAGFDCLLREILDQVGLFEHEADRAFPVKTAGSSSRKN